MKRRKKRMLRPMELWDFGAVQAWLEDEAARSWRLDSCFGYIASFTAAEPGPCRVRIQPQGPEAQASRQERLDAYAAMGWVYAAAIETDFEVYYCDDPDAPELDTDPVAWGWAWEKPLRRSWRNGWLTLLFLPLVLLLPVLLLSVKELLRLPLFLLFAELLMLPLLGVYLIWMLAQVRRMRRQLAAGVVPDFTGDWRKSRRRWKGLFLLLAVYWLLFALGRPPVDGLLRRQDPPALAISQLAPDGSLEQWTLETYSQGSAPLTPAYEELRLCGQDQARIWRTGDRLRFAALAGPLYRERLAEQRQLWPGAEETPVRDDRLDEAVLLTWDGCAWFLVRRGNLVASVGVNFPAELAEQTDRYAAELAAFQGEEEQR